MYAYLPLLQPHPYPDVLLHQQLDGNLSISFSNDSTNSNLNRSPPPNNPGDSPNFTPQLHSTPTHVPLPPSNDSSRDLDPAPPGLLDSLTSSHSASIQSWSDLDNFLPYALPPDLTIPSNSDPSIVSEIGHLTSSPHNIPVIVGHAPPNPQPQQRQLRSPHLHTIRSSNRAVTALSLPNICQSL